MPALIPTGFGGKITWIGRVMDRDTTLRAAPLTEAQLTFAGIDGEAHSGLTRASCSRVKSQYPTGTEIRNVRQLSVMSAEELRAVAQDIGAAEFDPAWIGASLVIEGIPDFTHVPPSSRLQFASGATITIDMENRPCVLPAKVINEDLDGAGQKFKSAATNKRGVTAWVEREGPIKIGDDVVLHIPDQRAWEYEAEVRG